MTAVEHAAKIVAAYIRSFQLGDGALAREIFLPNANLCGNERGKLSVISSAAYADYLAKRGPLPEPLLGLGRTLALHLHGPDLACATVEVFGPGKHYTDVLSLLKVDDAWKIAAKVYAWTPTERTAMA